MLKNAGMLIGDVDPLSGVQNAKNHKYGFLRRNSTRPYVRLRTMGQTVPQYIGEYFCSRLKKKFHRDHAVPLNTLKQQKLYQELRT